MSTQMELTIVIPAKNESLLLPLLLDSLVKQDYPGMRHTKVFVADAGSTDGTQDIALSYDPLLDIEVIPGGLPSVGRNAGARLAKSKFVLFIDADMELRDKTLIRRSLELANKRNMHCVTTNIVCRNGSYRDDFLYLANNVAQYGSLLVKPFSTGMYMLFDTAAFHQLGGFHEKALYAEDYLLSKKVRNRNFGIVSGAVYTTNRRFRNMGHFTIATMFLKTALNTWNDSYFMRDQEYWT